ncbi:exopolysaccharide production repressor protein [Allorhizobium terrae]|uniref:Exopolysaccharide production repressor exox n=1 Tax=Allorhizobium terrae TaxID=1848972 RepID=A0A4S3ZNY3_9HYPH|nr:exopolysaccharide production repressor protein [Allorhizobium terrae]THF47185.1 exopolysaccharide production repressor exox [Allorhizobium terrae]
MHAPKVFFSMIGALLVFAATTYYLSGSLSDTIIKTIIAAIVVQVGYFAVIVYYVAKEAKARKAALGKQEQPRPSPQDANKAPGLPETNHTVIRNG